MTARLGIRQRQEFTIRQQVHLNADTNAKNTTVGKTHNVLPILRQQAAQVFPRMQVGTQLQVSLRHGAARAGNRQQPEVTAQHLRQLSAGSNATQTITGTVQHRSAMLQLNR